MSSSAFEEVGGPSPTRGTWSAPPPRQVPAQPSVQAMEQLAWELGRVFRPSGRATHGVREGARRIAAEMMAAGATRDDVRRALTRAVHEHPIRLLLEQQSSAPDRSHWEALLADMLQCATDVYAGTRRRSLAD